MGFLHDIFNAAFERLTPADGGTNKGFFWMNVKDSNGRTLNLDNNSNMPITFGDSPAVDAFGRQRVSNPQTLFDSKNIFNDPGLADNVENQPLFYDNQETSGTGTSTAYNANESSQSLSVSATTAGKRTRRTKMRFNYQPGKSQLVMLTFNLEGGGTGICKREGIFDDNNGLFLCLDDGITKMVRRTKATGSVVDNEVLQSAWNIDTLDGSGDENNPSGVTLDLTKTQILFIDYEWLGVGRVRMGFVIGGAIYYVHEFLNANNLDVVYMQTPNLPLTSEIENDGTGAASSMTQICSTVISEGGSQDLGISRYISTAGTHLDANTENQLYALLGLRLKSAYIGTSIKILNAAIQLHTASHKCEWVLILNPTIAGSPSWTDLPQSAVQYFRGATANTITGGYQFTGGVVESGGVAAGGAGNASRGIDNALLLGSLIDGTVDELVLCVRPIGGSSNVDVEGTLNWREIV